MTSFRWWTFDCCRVVTEESRDVWTSTKPPRSKCPCRCWSSVLINEPSALRAATSAHFNSSARASAASARSMVCSYSRRHQAFDLHVLHDPAAIPQRRVHAAPAIAEGVASITYWALAMGIVQVPSETRCASPLSPESASRFRPTPCVWPTDRSRPPAWPC